MRSPSFVCTVLLTGPKTGRMREPSRRWSGSPPCVPMSRTGERKCSAKMKVISVIEDEDVIEKVLRHVGLWGLSQILPPAPGTRRPLIVNLTPFGVGRLKIEGSAQRPLRTLLHCFSPRKKTMEVFHMNTHEINEIKRAVSAGTAHTRHKSAHHVHRLVWKA